MIGFALALDMIAIWLCVRVCVLQLITLFLSLLCCGSFQQLRGEKTENRRRFVMNWFTFEAQLQLMTTAAATAAAFTAKSVYLAFGNFEISRCDENALRSLSAKGAQREWESPVTNL
jgi:hypothetical protein